MKRAVFIDIAKAICIILVVIGHFDQNDFPDWYRKMILGIYTFHMPLFMFASGFLYAMTKKDIPYKAFIFKKFCRLLIPYFTCSFIILSLKLFVNNDYSINQISYISYFRVLYQPEAGYFLWFIWSLWWIFMIVPFFKSKKQRLILFLIVTFIHYFPKEITSVFSLTPTKYMFMFFMLGVCLFDYRDEVSAKLKKVPLLVYFSLFVIAEYLLFNVPAFRWIKYVIAFIGIAFIVSLSLRLERINKSSIKRIFYVLSASSFFIFLFHTTFEGMAKLFLIKMSLAYNPENPLSLLFVVLFVVSIGVLFPVVLYNTVIVRFKITRFLFGVK